MEQAIATVVAAVISGIAAYLADRSRRMSVSIDRKLKVRQARLDERDLILSESGFSIPVDMDDSWRDYYNDRRNGDIRKDASEKARAKMPSSTSSLVGDRVSH